MNLQVTERERKNVLPDDLYAPFRKISPQCRLAGFFDSRQIATRDTQTAILLQGASPKDMEIRSGSRRYDTRRFAPIPFVPVGLFMANSAVIFFRIKV